MTQFYVIVFATIYQLYINVCFDDDFAGYLVHTHVYTQLDTTDILVYMYYSVLYCT